MKKILLNMGKNFSFVSWSHYIQENTRLQTVNQYQKVFLTDLIDKRKILNILYQIYIKRWNKFRLIRRQ